MILHTIRSGGQSGADQAALWAARDHGLATAGWAPPGWLTEDGPCPWLHDFHLVQHPSKGYPPRNRDNVRDADATLIFIGREFTPGSQLTMRNCEGRGKYYRIVRMPGIKGYAAPESIAAWIVQDGVGELNVAGSRETKAPGIGIWVEGYLARVFRELRRLS